MPTLTTNTITNITSTTAISGGLISDDGGASVTVRGVCWSTNSEPTIYDNKTIDGSGTGSFSSSLTGLNDGSTYYVRAYATTNSGTAYGNQLSFIARNTITDYDGNVYGIVEIGSQIWMAENLTTTHYADGTAIPFVENGTDWDNLEYNSKAMFNYSANAYHFGAWYTWVAAMNGAMSSTSNPSNVQGVCPDGWHIPSDAEWKELEMFLGMSQTDADAINYRGTNQGSKLANNADIWGNGSLITAIESDPEFGSSGFNAVPARGLQINGYFTPLWEDAFFWTSTEDDTFDAYFRGLKYTITGVWRDNLTKNYGWSVRCVKD